MGGNIHQEIHLEDKIKIMTEKEIEKLLKKANNERLFGDTAKALAILHQLHTEFPKEKKYIGLLASTYYGKGEKEIALEYCEKALALDPNYKEIYELKGMIAYLMGDIVRAEQFYKKALEIDPLFAGDRIRLAQLYFEQKQYEQVIEECSFILKNNDIERWSYTIEQKDILLINWLLSTYSLLWQAFIELKEYKKAIETITEYLKFASCTVKDPYYFHQEDELLFKLYYLIGDQKKFEEYKDRWLHFYKVVQGRVLGMQKDADQGYIITTNFDNYNIDENGVVH